MTSCNTYSVSMAEQFHDLPVEISLHSERVLGVIETLLWFLFDEQHQVILLHFFAAADVGTDVGYNALVKLMAVWFKTVYKCF